MRGDGDGVEAKREGLIAARDFAVYLAEVGGLCLPARSEPTRMLRRSMAIVLRRSSCFRRLVECVVSIRSVRIHT
jgi:hypothetical protein